VSPSIKEKIDLYEIDLNHPSADAAALLESLLAMYPTHPDYTNTYILESFTEFPPDENWDDEAGFQTPTVAGGYMVMQMPGDPPLDMEGTAIWTIDDATVASMNLLTVEFTCKTNAVVDQTDINVQFRKTGNGLMASIWIVGSGVFHTEPASADKIKTGLEASTDYTIRVVFHFNTLKIDIYVDDVLCKEALAFITSSTALNNVRFSNESSVVDGYIHGLKRWFYTDLDNLQKALSIETEKHGVDSLGNHVSTTRFYHKRYE